MNFETTIGIDPDLTKNGVAVVSNGHIISLHAMSLYELVAFIESNKSTAQFVLENVEYDGAVYVRPKTNRAVMLNIAQKVGMVKGTCRHIEEYLRDSGAVYRKVKPLTGQVKKAKDSAEFFNRLTGWDGSSNQDKRDAALLALYG